MRKFLILALGLAMPLGAAEQTLDPISRADFKKLRPHPRLILSDEGLKEMKEALPLDAALAGKLEILRKAGEEILAAPASERVLKGPRLLSVSREVVRRLYSLGLLYRLSGEERYAARARQEMLAVARFSDWNPSHFLDVAEMSHGLALGYDWFLPALSKEERRTIRQALVEKGLKPGLPLYATDEWQVSSEHNWNQVCNGGLGLAALALADEEPELAHKILKNALRLFPNALKSYGSDGGWAEGPAYWDYATRYTCYFQAGLESALGGDFGMSRFEGLRKAGDFHMHASGPGRRTFNYADGKEHLSSSQAMFYLAGRYQRPIYAAINQWEFEDKDASAQSLIWHPRGPAADLEQEPKDAFFKGVNVAFFRSRWADNHALYAGFKGGDNAANHAHLDIGSFVLDADNIRWGVDLGADDYNLPGFWDKGEGGQRWQYYRVNSQSHNILTLDGKDQKVEAQAPITAFASRPELAFAVADMGAAYPKASSARRGLAMLDRAQVLVQDEITLKEDGGLRWAMMTKAKVSAKGAKAVLSQDGKKLEARILSPKGARFEVLPALPPTKVEMQNEDFRILAIKLKPGTSPLTLAVSFKPQGKAWPKSAEPKITPLAEWK